MTDQETANATYRELIDGLVQAAPSLSARLVREEGIASKAPAAVAANELVSRLSRSIGRRSRPCSRPSGWGPSTTGSRT